MLEIGNNKSGCLGPLVWFILVRKDISGRAFYHPSSSGIQQLIGFAENNGMEGGEKNLTILVVDMEEAISNLDEVGAIGEISVVEGLSIEVQIKQK